MDRIEKRIFIDSKICECDANILVLNFPEKTIIPINLLSDVENIGFFSTDSDNMVTISENVKHSGGCKSRLEELRLYTFSDIFEDKYIIYDGVVKHGVVLSETNNDKITYYIDGILFVDDLIWKTTEYTLDFEAVEMLNNAGIIFDDSLITLVGKPKIKNNINLDRGGFTVNEEVLKLGAAMNLYDLTNYAGGSYYNIINNN